MLLEIHAHTTKYSPCSNLLPVDLIHQAHNKGMQGVVITEHKYLWNDDELKKLKTESEVEDVFVIIAGQEVETDIGHVLVYGADKSIKDYIKLEDLRRAYPKAALIWAHPFRGGKVPSEKELLNPSLDGVEIFNTNQNAKENYLALKLWHKYRFNAVAGSDAHSRDAAAIFPSIFDHPIKTAQELAVEIKNKRTRPFLKEIPKSGSNVTVTEITMGTKGTDEFRTRLIAKQFFDAKKWEAAKISLGMREKIYNKGFDAGKFRVARTVERDDKNQIIIEEGQRGKNLYELLSFTNPKVGKNYFNLTAEWLGAFHNIGLKIDDADNTRARESKRLDGYLNSFAATKNAHTAKIKKIIDFVRRKEDDILKKDKLLVQCHGDYHPKNIIIGQDRMHDISTLYISVIDFDNSILYPKAYDVGYFISQYLYQFYKMPYVMKEYQEEDFLKAYMAKTEGLPKNFKLQVELFKLRANLSIASFLIKVGKGVGEDMEFVMKASSSIFSKIS